MYLSRFVPLVGLVFSGPEGSMVQIAGGLLLAGGAVFGLLILCLLVMFLIRFAKATGF